VLRGTLRARRELFRLPEDVDISLTFGCKEPMSGSHLKLEGMGAFDAAVHCASVAAAERQQRLTKSTGVRACGRVGVRAGARGEGGGGGEGAAIACERHMCVAPGRGVLSRRTHATCCCSPAERQPRLCWAGVSVCLALALTSHPAGACTHTRPCITTRQPGCHT
jgi:hypothetical protein